jgi:DNA-binding MarR family transcriptional regulator
VVQANETDTRASAPLGAVDAAVEELRLAEAALSSASPAEAARPEVSHPGTLPAGAPLPGAGEAGDELHDLAVAVYMLGQRIRQLHLKDPVDRATLAVLWQVSELGEVRPSELAGTLGLDLSTISRHVRALCDEEYLARTRDPADRRACRLTVTPLGAEIIRQAWESRRAAVTAAVQGWSRDDQLTLTALLTRLAEDMAHK